MIRLICLIFYFIISFWTNASQDEIRMHYLGVVKNKSKNILQISIKFENLTERVVNIYSEVDVAEGKKCFLDYKSDTKELLLYTTLTDTPVTYYPQANYITLIPHEEYIMFIEIKFPIEQFYLDELFIYNNTIKFNQDMMNYKDKALTINDIRKLKNYFGYYFEEEKENLKAIKIVEKSFDLD